MKNSKFSFLLILVGSIFVFCVMFMNFNSFLSSFSTPGYEPPILVSIATFLNFMITVLSLVTIRRNNQSKLWYLPVLLMSAIGNLLYSFSSLLLIMVRKERLSDAQN